MTNTLSRKWVVDVTNDTTLASGWINVKGITGVTPSVTPNLEDSSDYNTNGWSSSEPTMMSWTCDVGINRLASDVATGQVPVYDPGQEMLRAKVGLFGDAARIGIRWYDRQGGPEAAQGVGIVTWKPGTGAVKNLEAVTVTVTGTDVPLDQAIANPINAALAPAVAGISPVGAAAGQPVAIQGAALTGTTAVTFAGTEAEKFDVINDGLIIATLPTGSAGTVSAVVTNPNGSATVSYVRD